MSERVKGKAFCFIRNDSRHEWNERQAKGRKKALEKLAHTLSAPSDRKKIPAIHPQTVEWKAGDIVLAKLDMHENDDQKYFAMQVFTVFHMPYSQFIPDGPQEQIPVVGIYRWIGSHTPSMDELLRCGFVASPHYPTKPQSEKPPYVSCMTLSKMDRKRYSYSVIRNSTDYLHIIDAQSISSQIGPFWGNFDAYTKPQKGNKTDRKDAKWICDLFMCDMIKPSFTLLCSNIKSVFVRYEQCIY